MSSEIAVDEEKQKLLTEVEDLLRRCQYPETLKTIETFLMANLRPSPKPKHKSKSKPNPKPKPKPKPNPKSDSEFKLRMFTKIYTPGSGYNCLYFAYTLATNDGKRLDDSALNTQVEVLKRKVQEYLSHRKYHAEAISRFDDIVDPDAREEALAGFQKKWNEDVGRTDPSTNEYQGEEQVYALVNIMGRPIIVFEGETIKGQLPDVQYIRYEPLVTVEEWNSTLPVFMLNQGNVHFTALHPNPVYEDAILSISEHLVEQTRQDRIATAEYNAANAAADPTTAFARDDPFGESDGDDKSGSD